MKALFLAGRIAFGGFFIYSGIHNIRKWRMVAQFADAKHVPQPEAAAMLSGALMLLGGTLISLGVKPKLGAAAIVTFLGTVSPIMHDFWKQQDPGQQMQEMENFSKNMALLGAAIALMGVEEPWPMSVPVDRPKGVGRILHVVRELAA